MKKYRVCGVVIGGKYLGVFEANSPEEAVDAAMCSEAAYVSLCHQCSPDCENAEIQSVDAEEISEEEYVKEVEAKP